MVWAVWKRVGEVVETGGCLSGLDETAAGLIAGRVLCAREGAEGARWRGRRPAESGDGQRERARAMAGAARQQESVAPSRQRASASARCSGTARLLGLAT